LNNIRVGYRDCHTPDASSDVGTLQDNANGSSQIRQRKNRYA